MWLIMEVLIVDIRIKRVFFIVILSQKKLHNKTNKGFSNKIFHIVNFPFGLFFVHLEERFPFSVALTVLFFSLLRSSCVFSLFQ